MFSGAKFEATDTVTAARGGPGENELQGSSGGTSRKTKTFTGARF